MQEGGTSTRYKERGDFSFDLFRSFRQNFEKKMKELSKSFF